MRALLMKMKNLPISILFLLSFLLVLPYSSLAEKKSLQQTL